VVFLLLQGKPGKTLAALFTRFAKKCQSDRIPRFQ
jgi:hypothetical protein